MIKNNSIVFQAETNTPYITWPTLYPAYSASLLSLQFQLEQSQWWQAKEIINHQLQQVSLVFHHAQRTVPLYQEKYKQIDLGDKDVFSEQDWLNLPILSREEAQSSAKLLISNAPPKQHGKLTDISTSGSTGRSVQLKYNELTNLFWKVNTLREHLWHKRDFRKSLAVIRVFSGNDISQIYSLDNWGESTEAVTKTGPAYGIDIRNSISLQVDFLLNVQPSYLLTYPSNALALAEYFQSNNLKLTKLLELRTLSETLPESTRAFCEQVFNTRVVDTYSCQETGYIALQCPQHNHYHIQSETVLVEVLNDNDEPCKAGETGRVIISSLHNFATPVLRYDIGDYAQVGSTCSCGRGLPVLNKILGRVRNMLTYPSGDKVWPILGSEQFNQFAKIKQFQFIQLTRQKLVMRYVADNEMDVFSEEKLRLHIQGKLNYPFDIAFQYESFIERGKGGKYEDFISKL